MRILQGRWKAKVRFSHDLVKLVNEALYDYHTLLVEGREGWWYSHLTSDNNAKADLTANQARRSGRPLNFLCIMRITCFCGDIAGVIAIGG